jgi:hypothetical protein
LIPPEELEILRLDDKIKTIRQNPSIPYEQFDRLFDKKIRETITNYKINDFIDTISNDVGDIDHISKIDKMNKEFQDLIYDYLNQMN